MGIGGESNTGGEVKGTTGVAGTGAEVAEGTIGAVPKGDIAGLLAERLGDGGLGAIDTGVLGTTIEGADVTSAGVERGMLPGMHPQFVARPTN
jgi:hypothetical protein